MGKRKQKLCYSVTCVYEHLCKTSLHTDTHTHTYIHTETQTHRRTDTQTHRHTDTHTDLHTDAQTDRERERERERERRTDTQTHTHTATDTHPPIHPHPYTPTPTHTPTHTHTDITGERGTHTPVLVYGGHEVFTLEHYLPKSWVDAHVGTKRIRRQRVMPVCLCCPTHHQQGACVCVWPPWKSPRNFR